MSQQLFRSRWAAIGAAVAVTLGAGGLSLADAAVSSGDKPVFVALERPCRVADTRSVGTVGPRNTPIGPAQSHEIRITGGSGTCTGALAVPNDAVAVALNVTAINNTTRSHFRVYPADATLPTTSNLNFGPGQTPIANKVDVGLSSTGRIRIFNLAGTTDAAVDVFGYYIDHTHDDRYYTEEEIDTRLSLLPGQIFSIGVDSAGTITRQSGGISVTRLGSIYRYTFPRDVDSCAWTATIGGNDPNSAYAAVGGDHNIAASLAYDATWPPTAVFNAIDVQLYDGTGSNVDNAHMLVVTCPTIFIW